MHHCMINLFRYTGHNIVLGGSHYDQYHLDYIGIWEHTNGVHDSWFTHPHGMRCTPSTQPFGPTRSGANGANGANGGNGAMTFKTHASPLDDLRRLFPEGDKQPINTFILPFNTYKQPINTFILPFNV